MNLTIKLPDEEVPALKAKATARGVSAEQYVLEDSMRPAPRQFNNLSDLLLNSPFAGANLDLERSNDQSRTVDLG